MSAALIRCCLQLQHRLMASGSEEMCWISVMADQQALTSRRDDAGEGGGEDRQISGEVWRDNIFICIFIRLSAY